MVSRQNDSVVVAIAVLIWCFFAANTDYIPVNVTINLSLDVRQQSVPITIIEDDFVELNEQFFVKMENVDDRPVQFQLRETIVIIVTNDGKTHTGTHHC